MGARVECAEPAGACARVYASHGTAGLSPRRVTLSGGGRANSRGARLSLTAGASVQQGPATEVSGEPQSAVNLSDIVITNFSEWYATAKLVCESVQACQHSGWEASCNGC